MKKLKKLLFAVTAFIVAVSAVSAGFAFIAERIEEIKNKGKKFIHKPFGIYERFIKRPLDCFLSMGALMVLSPVMLFLTVFGAFKMKGNPFFTQKRPGRIDPETGRETVFNLIKFKSMTDEKDENGRLLPDDIRLTDYGKMLRNTSLDELGELLNIIKGDMAVVGPRPQLVRDMVFMTPEQRKRHTVRQGLTGLAQCSGRNGISWEDKLRLDCEYIDNGITFKNDMKIILKTVGKVFAQEGISEEGMATALDFGDYLLSTNKVSQEKYDELQAEAAELLKL